MKATIDNIFWDGVSAKREF